MAVTVTVGGGVAVCVTGGEVAGAVTILPCKLICTLPSIIRYPPPPEKSPRSLS